MGIAFIPCAPRLKVVLADDYPVMREGLASLIGHECDMAVAGSADTASELRNVVDQSSPDILVMELMLHDEDGLALIKDLLNFHPGLKIVVFTQQPAEIYATRCLKAGARGYVSKRDAVTSLLRAIRQTANGGIVVPPSVSANLFTNASAREESSTGVAAPLTNRELQVFRLVGLAQPTRLIAEKLGVSIKTVETHRENIKNKLAIHSHDELVACASQWLREKGGS